MRSTPLLERGSCGRPELTSHLADLVKLAHLSACLGIPSSRLPTLLPLSSFCSRSAARALVRSSPTTRRGPGSPRRRSAPPGRRGAATGRAACPDDRPAATPPTRPRPARPQSSLAPGGGLRGDKVTGKLSEEEAGLAQRRRDHHGEAAFQNRPGGLECGHRTLAALTSH